MVSAKTVLTEQARNVVENLACRIAEQEGGRLAPHHLMPFLPVSLELIEKCLRDMVDGSSVIETEEDEIQCFEFPAQIGKSGAAGVLALTTCVSCANDLESGRRVLCRSCAELLHTELNSLAERIGWPAQAVYEHEILYLAAGQPGPARAETLAGRSRYTLRSMRRKLERLCLERRARQDLDPDAGAVVYHFPALTYPRAQYQANMAVIRRYPASITEEVELKLVRIVLTLTAFLLILFLLAFLHAPFPVLVGAFLVGAPIAAIRIWRHREAADGE